MVRVKQVLNPCSGTMGTSLQVLEYKSYNQIKMETYEVPQSSIRLIWVKLCQPNWMFRCTNSKRKFHVLKILEVKNPRSFQNAIASLAKWTAGSYIDVAMVDPRGRGRPQRVIPATAQNDPLGMAPVEQDNKDKDEMESGEDKAMNGKDMQCDEVVDLDDSDECEMDNLIRIRTHEDGIFESDEDDSDLEYLMPEVELYTPPPAPRKRKQDVKLTPIDGDEEYDLVLVDNNTREEGGVSNEHTYGEDTFQFTASRRRDRTPLYLLNPADFAHDPKKQIQIRRAIITYKHHREKKEQIIKLTNENQQLRKLNESLKLKVLELSSCGCEKNKNSSIDILDVQVPEVPPRMYVRGKKTILASPYNQPSGSPLDHLNSSGSTLSSVKNEVDVNPNEAVSPPTNQQMSVPRPLINMSSTTLSKVNLTTSNGTQFLPQRFLNGGTVRQNVASTSVQRQRNLAPSTRPVASTSNVSMMRIKNEPGVSTSAQNISSTAATMPSLLQIGTSIQNLTGVPLQAIKTETLDTTPATATTASRIVFAKKPVTSTNNPVQTASQLLFGARTSTVNAIQQPTPALTASQLALGNRIRPSPATASTAVTAEAPKVFRTASGQILRLVAPPTPRQQLVLTRPPQQPALTRPQQPALTRPQQPALTRPSQLQFKPIRPKPPAGVPTPMSQADLQAKELAELWKKFEPDEDDDDEMAMLDAINGVPPAPTRNRKQTFSQAPRNPLEEIRPRRQVIKAGESEIELNKYADIVFEEAD